jgi:hypothetical protein
MPAKPICEVLCGRKEICNFLNISPNLFYEYVAMGMPVVKRRGNKRDHWVGNVKAINDWSLMLVKNEK